MWLNKKHLCIKMIAAIFSFIVVVVVVVSYSYTILVQTTITNIIN